MRILSSLILTILCGVSTFGQSGNDWWKMPGTQPANPRKAQPARPEPTPTLNAIDWAFPKAAHVAVEISGETYYKLSDEAFAKKGRIGEDKRVETAVVLFTPKIVAVVQLMQIDRPQLDADVFLTMAAVKLAVENPAGELPAFWGKSAMIGMTFHVYRMKSGRFIAAHISEDHSRVILLPGPVND